MTDVSENSINRFQEGKDSKKLMKEKHRELKEKYREMKKDYEYLESLTQEELSPKAVDFKDPKVIQLWSQAKRANFSDMELLSLKVKNLQHNTVKMIFWFTYMLLSCGA